MTMAWVLTPTLVFSRKERRGLGLVGIRERLNAVGGTLHIDSVVGRGTELLVKIPVET
jgi:signal transduction histidine kinase